MASAAVVVVLAAFPAALSLVDLTILLGLIQVPLERLRRFRIICINCSLIYYWPPREVSRFDGLEPC